MEHKEPQDGPTVKSDHESVESQGSASSEGENAVAGRISPMSEEDLDSEYVNIGYYNWLALRQNWKTPAPNWKPAPKKHIDTSKIYEEMQTHGQVSQRVPLSDFVQVVFEIWETEGFN